MRAQNEHDSEHPNRRGEVGKLWRPKVPRSALRQKLKYVDSTRTKLNTGDDVPTISEVHKLNRAAKDAARTAADALYNAAVASGDENRIKEAKDAKNACRQRYDEWSGRVPRHHYLGP